MGTADVGHDVGLTHARVFRWIGLAIIIAVGLILVSRLNDAIRRPTYNAPTAQNGVSSIHCAHYIEVAKAAYGADWKYRLDPRDTTCAQQVQEQWQHEWNARQPMQPLPQGTMTISAPTEPIVDTGPSPIDSRIRNPETYCLNVISLARSRYGADWASKVTPEEAANCSEQIHAVGSR
jgi:hypothetical protein